MSLVAIVGRPNVGKSTLFNRLIRERRAIVEATPGVTRDRLYAPAEWAGRHFTVIDTGGWIPESDDLIAQAVREQTALAIEEADAIVFVVDAREGMTPIDQELAALLRAAQKPVFIAVNKCDTAEWDAMAAEFYQLGLGNPYPIAAASGRSLGELLDALVAALPEGSPAEPDIRVKLAILGRPNVGKSSLVNALLGRQQVIVTPIPGTTRDAVDTVVRYNGEEFLLIDTAGLRRRSRIQENVELYSVVRTLRALERCDVAAVVVDAYEGLREQDKRIVADVVEARKGVFLVFNKWDLVEKDAKTADWYVERVREELPGLLYIPVLFVSALTRQRVTKILELAKRISERRRQRISTSQLNRTLLPVIERTPPPAVQGKEIRINYVTQVRTEPPVFVFFCNHPDLIPDSYKRFLEGTLREHFDFEGVPISFLFRRKNVPYTLQA
ncbi:MAG: ribosome biogenesis GTPase Der [Candidatus Kapabacteria bacterium]|nr:ribosome biogenesis GTPase Der [Candidatus Kapabacteria bacterium]MDW8012660.1 ribosome biogenesis GTPase Der [Bacteroidota bacterium]